MDLIRIKMMDGFPCIILEDDIFWLEEDLKIDSKKLIMPEYFTNNQKLKEQSYYSKVLEELKKKFGEK